MTDDPFATIRIFQTKPSTSYIDVLDVTPVTQKKGAGVTQNSPENGAVTPVTPVTQTIGKGDRWRARYTEIQTQIDLPLKWAKAFATVEQMPTPKGAAPGRWEQIVADARTFMWRCAGHAVAAGWGVADAFGFDPDDASTDMGFVFLIRGGVPIVDNDGTAAIRSGDHWTWFRARKMDAEIPMIWDVRSPNQHGGAQKVRKIDD